MLADLDRQYPGVRFRMVDEQDRTRRHMRFFVRGAPVFDLGTPLAPNDEPLIVQALSGGDSRDRATSVETVGLVSTVK